MHLVQHLDYDFNLNFLLSHDVVPTNARLFKRHIVQSPSCVWCEETETVSHVLYFCDKVQLSLDWLQTLLSSSSRPMVFLEDDFIFGTFQVKSNILKLVIITTYLLKSHIWKQRYRELTYGIQMTDEGLLHIFQSKLRYRIKLDFHRLPRSLFRAIWFAVKGLADIRENTLFILF